MRMIGSRALLAIALALLGAGCASLPDRVERLETKALSNTDSTRLGAAIRQRTAAQPGKSGIHPLGVARDAFAARVLLARSAERSLDMQYFIWHGDTTGQLLWEAAWQAAERGVRVRLLLDDANTSGLDATIAALDAHPNIEVRLFNPFAHRLFRAADFASDFSRVNRRMHNKSFTADNQASIVGGRNVGDEYYGANLQIGFQDLDVLAIGPVVNEVSRQFDLYWNSDIAYPAASVLRPAQPDAAAMLKQTWDKLHQGEDAARYVESVRQTPLVQQLLSGQLAMEWTQAQVMHDHPDKVRNPIDRYDLQLLPLLQEVFGKVTRELDLVSPYFVPGQNGTRALGVLAQRGIQVRVLTNSLSATDVSPVHAGYSRYRKELLRSGVLLYELKPEAAAPPPKDDDDKRVGIFGSSSASLHAKTFSVDRSRIFVGSFNLDPRSARLNTEMGVLIDSPELAQRLSHLFEDSIPDQAYQVRLEEGADTLEWIERGRHGEARYTTEPRSSALRRLWIGFLSLMPGEWLL
jgi:putative cardiolipin synthase